MIFHVLTFHETPTLIVTFVAIGVTFIGVIWTGILTRKSNDVTRESNELMEKDLSLKHRPWIVISVLNFQNTKVKMDNGIFKILSMEKILEYTIDKLHLFGQSTITWILNIENTGITPGLNFSIDSITRWNKEITVDELKKSKISPMKSNILFPHEKTTHRLSYDVKNWKEGMGRNLWAGYVFRYEFEDHLRKTQSVSIYKIWKFNLLEWIE